MKRAEILNLSLFSKWQRMNRLVCMFFLLLKGKGHVNPPWQQLPRERGTGSNPWAEFNFFSKRIPNFTWIQTGPRDIIQITINSPQKPFVQSCSHFQGTLEIWEYQEDIFSLTWKNHFFKQRKLFDWDFVNFLGTAQGMCCHFAPMPKLPYLHVFPGGDWLSLPLLNSTLAPAQNI